MTTTPTLRPPTASGSITPHPDGSLFADLLQRAIGGVTALSIAAPAVAAFARGERDPNHLTDAVFYARHPELHGRPIARGQQALIQEWTWIRNSVITPILRQLAAAATAIATAPPIPASSRFTLPPDPANLLPAARTQIAAEPLFPGENVLAAEIQLIKDVASRPDGWVYIANWFADLHPPEKPSCGPTPPYVLQPFVEALSACARSGGTIRALFWEGSLRDLASRISKVMEPLDHVSEWLTWGISPTIAIAQHLGVVPQPSAIVGDAIRWIAHKQTNYAQNSRSAALINQIVTTNRLPVVRAVALLDDATLTLGSHHQKIFVAGNSERTVAVVGGFDLNPDRVVAICDEPGTPFYDISLNVDGQAAGDVAEIFERRWNANPLRRAIPLPRRVPPQSRPHGQGATVQVGVNYGCGYPMRDIPHAVRGANALIKNLLDNCRRFFYAEDQYGTGNAELRAGILKAFANGASFGIVVLAASAGVTDTPEIDYWRYKFWSGFSEINRSLLVFERLGDDSRPTGPHAYVHSKFLLVDDEAASIASVNMNRRSWYNDSELAAVVTDAPELIRGLRTGMWASHLWGPTRKPWPQEQIADPMAGLEVWRAAHDGRRRGGYLKPLTFVSAPQRRMPAGDHTLEEAYRILQQLPGGVAETVMSALRDEIVDPQGPSSC